ncbi:MAG: threonine ammonia-lyase [Planctomycetes bacterium]|nr:threonine ammonia-lyase [Planctomycetota bacterium]
MVTLENIQAARAGIREAVYLSPLGNSETLSKATGKRVYLKLDNLQMTGSFKERGALWRLLQLSEAERVRGVITASAGNHALAVAYHASRLGVKACVVMPETTPLIKVVSVREHGAEIVLHGHTFDEAYHRSRELEKESGAVYVHAFNDPWVIAGQGTIGLELLEQEPGLDAVVVPVGGGGLISGIATAMKKLKPRIKVIGVEAESWPAMKISLEQGRIMEIGATETLADGIAVKRVGDLTFPIISELVDQMVTVTEEELANAILILAEREKTIAEGAGAAALAALINRKFWIKEQNVAAVVSGGNIDMNMISRIIERGLAKDGRRVRLVVEIPDRPGSLHKLTGVIARLRANILDIVHDRAFIRGSFGNTEVEATLETRGRDHITQILEELKAAGFRAREET